MMIYCSKCGNKGNDFIHILECFMVHLNMSLHTVVCYNLVNLGMPGTFSPPSRVSDPDMHHGTCVMHVPWCMLGSLKTQFPLQSVAGKMFSAFPAHTQPVILCIWQVAHGRCGSNFKSVIYEHMLWITFMTPSCETALRWMPHYTFNDKWLR